MGAAQLLKARDAGLRFYVLKAKNAGFSSIWKEAGVFCTVYLYYNSMLFPRSELSPVRR